jgi:hypothetical protein
MRSTDFLVTKNAFHRVMCGGFAFCILESMHTVPQIEAAAKETVESFHASSGSTIVNTPSIQHWYRVILAHHQWTLFQVVLYTLLLTR